MQCPSCAAEMLVEGLCGVQVEVCSKCGGIWFDNGELGKAVHGDPVDLNEFAEAHKSEPKDVSHLMRRCPKCLAVLCSYRYQYHSPILLDSCDQCGGLFVDQGELVQIEEFLDQSQRPDPKAEAALAVADLDFKSQKAKDRAYWVARSAWTRRSTGSHSWWQWGLDEHLKW